MARLAFSVCLAVLSLCLLIQAQATERPVVGVLAQEIPKELKHLFPDENSYIPASYVKAVEAAGARVVPIFINKTMDYYSHIISSINGVVFPGGDAVFTDPNGVAAAASIILDLAQKLQNSGVSIPILGVCQGYELLMFLAANCSTDILIDCDCKNAGLPLRFLPGFNESSLYSHASTEIIEILQTLPVTSNHHSKCVIEERLKSHNLEKTWRVLSKNLDNHGLEFISSSEHFERPLVGIQFHPEKNMFEWNPKQVNPHSRKAILSARLFYDWLVFESRTNNQSFPSTKEEEATLIYNYSPIYTGKRGGYNEQVYLFA